jgi:malate dehydrogenase
VIPGQSEAVVLDQHRVLPLVVRLDGEFGYDNVYAGVAGRLGRNGIEGIVDTTLNADELAVFDNLRSEQQALVT